MYNCVIIDDETHSKEIIEKYIETIPFLNLVAFYHDPIIALHEINNNDEIDLIILDIEMPEISGLELSKELRGKSTKIIFITAHDKYAFEAFEIFADGYLLKPFSLLKFTSLIMHLFKDENGGAIKRNPKNFFFVKDKSEKLITTKIDFDDIIAIESLHNDVKIYTREMEIIAYSKLGDIKDLLSKNKNFIQVHRSFIISMNHIKTINGLNLKMQGNLFIRIGQSYGERFMSLVKNNTLQSKKIQKI